MCELASVTGRLTCNERKFTSYLPVFKAALKSKNLPYFTPNEVAQHNSEDDCWVSILGVVRDLTSLVTKYKCSSEILPILAFAGKDISAWFDSRTGDVLHHVHPVTGVRVPYMPHGILPDVLPQVPTSAWKPLGRTPWWLDPELAVGYVTENARPIRIKNMLTGGEVTIEVGSEDTLDRVLERYSMFNSRAGGYTWKYETRVLNPRWTLGENHVPDPRPRLRRLRLPEDLYVPCLMLYFNDDHSQ